MDIEQIRQELAEKITKIAPIGKRLKFELDEHYILIDGSGEENIISDKNEDADCTVIMSIDTYLKLQRKEIKPIVATLKRKLKVRGDLSVAKKLKQLM